MRRLLSSLGRGNRGVSAVELALCLPIFLPLLMGIAQFGILFFANSGLAHAVGEGARLATIYPRPTDAQIIARMSDRRYGLDPSKLSAPTIQHGDASGAHYVVISMSYTTTLDFIFFQSPAITLDQNRRVFTHS